MGKPFPDWNIASLLGPIFMVIAGGAVLAILTLTGFAFLQKGDASEQTVTHWVDQQGDVKRLCLAYKTGDHVDALSCTLIDPMTGDAYGQ